MPKRRRSRKRRVLVVGPYPPPYSGPEMAIKAILESPIQQRFDLRHLSTNVRKTNQAKGRFGPSMVWAFFVFLTRLVNQLVRFRPDVVYCFVTATRLGWLGRDVWCIAVSRLFGAQVVTHMRAGHFKNNLAGAPSWQLAIIRWACRQVRWSVVQASSLRDQFEGLAPEDRIAVIPNMIDTDRYYKVNADQCTPSHILFLGHLSQAKGYADLLRAIPRVAEVFPDVVFRFAGAKIDKESNVFHDQATGARLPTIHCAEIYDQEIAGRFEANYEYLGMLDEDDKIQALCDCTFLVLPSYSEGFSMAILEAISMGKPIVCTGVGAMRDYLMTGVHGEVIAPGDVDSLVASILKLLGDADYRNRVALHNGDFAREQFSQAVVAQQLGDLWQSA